MYDQIDIGLKETQKFVSSVNLEEPCTAKEACTHLEIASRHICVLVELLVHRLPIHRLFDDDIIIWNICLRHRLGEQMPSVEPTNYKESVSKSS